MGGAAFKSNSGSELVRPDIFSYREYKPFLRDYLHYLKLADPNFSIRRIASEANISLGYISTILNTGQDITDKALEKIVPFLKLSRPETSYLRILCSITESSTQEERFEGLKKLQRFHKYTQLNANDALVSQFFSKWYYVAIREMANQPNFQPVPSWIQEQLAYSVSLSEISKTLEFLMHNKLIRIAATGKYTASEDRMICEGNIFRFILTHFHKQVFEVAVKAIDLFKRERRNVRGHTMCLTSKNYDKAKEIMDKALEEIAALTEKSQEESSVYHFMFLGFPLTKLKGDSEK